MPTPSWVLFPPKVWSSQEQCVHPGATEYYGEDNTSKFILPYGSTKIQRLTDESGNYFRSANELTQQIPNTNKLLFITSLYGQWHSPGPRNLRIVNNWNETFPAGSTLTGLGNVQSNMTKDYDYTLNDNGVVVDGVRTGEIATSANGEWVHALVEQKAYILLNTETHEIIPYAEVGAFYPTYAMKVDVSNDGRFVARTFDLNSFKIFDTSRCQADQGAFVPRNCQSLELLDGENSLLHNLFPGKNIVIGHVKFIGNGDALDIDLRIGDGTNYQYFTYRLKPSGSEPVKYLAMGDSFSSGEGAFDYVEATDRFVSNDEYNVCHLSRKSYPYLLQQSLQADWFHSVACSGSDSKDIVFAGGRSGYMNSIDAQAKFLGGLSTGQDYFGNMRPGYVPQSEFVAKHNPDIVTISVGGNDVGFSNIIAGCVMNFGTYQDFNCLSDRDERESKANEIDQKISQWSTTFVDIKNSLGGSDPKLYVIGYPSMFKSGGICGINVRFDPSETERATQLTDYLNAAVKAAADAAGVRYVDVSDAFTRMGEDYRLCNFRTDFAVNGLDLWSIINECTSAKAPDAKVCPDSFHPNERGQKLMTETILQKTMNLSQEMPQNSNSTAYLIDKRMDFVGDVAITLQNHRITFQKDIAPQLIAKGEKIQINLPKSDNELPAKTGTTATATAHSAPRELGQLSIAADGTITGEVTLPEDIETGYHKLIISYTDIADNIVERYMYFYAAQSQNDWDGDGIDNASDPCVSVAQSGVDQDEDGIDDACDGEYVKSAQDTSNIELTEPRSNINNSNNASARAHISLPEADSLTIVGGSGIDDLFTTQSDTGDFHFSDQSNTKTDLSSSKVGQRSDRQDQSGSDGKILIITTIVVLTGVFGTIGLLAVRRREI